MQVNAHIDVDVVAIEQEDEVTVLLELQAPVLDEGGERPPAAVQVVLDRSGSMADGRLEAAKEALLRLVDRLDPSDHFGLVAFDDQVQVVVPAAPLTDKPAVRRAIAALEPGGMTNLSGGLLRGLQEARRATAAGGAGATLLLLSDGHANQGETDATRLRRVAAGARDRGVTTSTIGIGLGYDERLLAEMAAGGQGDHVFAEHGDAAAAAVAGQVEGLLSKTVQAASLLVRPDGPVGSLTVWNDLPAAGIDGGVLVELGDLWSGEERKVVLTFAVPAKAELGLARIAELELRYVAVPELAEQTVTLPVCVNVVPGDQAAGRIADPKVRTELVYQRTQQAKRRGADALRDGDLPAARAAWAEADGLIAAAPPTADLLEEREVLRSLRERADAGEEAWAAKFSRADTDRKSRRRGRGM